MEKFLFLLRELFPGQILGMQTFCKTSKFGARNCMIYNLEIKE